MALADQAGIQSEFNSRKGLLLEQHELRPIVFSTKPPSAIFWRIKNNLDIFQQAVDDLIVEAAKSLALSPKWVCIFAQKQRY